jgi:hypothetical protein
MDSDASSSFLAPSTTQVSSRSGSKQIRGIASVVWDHCRIAHENEDLSQKYCNYCTDPNVPPYGSTVSSNMRKHLKAKHAIIVEVEPSRIQATTLGKLR